jgi:hypothetical protein
VVEARKPVERVCQSNERACIGSRTPPDAVSKVSDLVRSSIEPVGDVMNDGETGAARQAHSFRMNE